MVGAVRFARSTDHLFKGSKINFTETITFHWMWLEWTSSQQLSHHGLAQGALSCIAGWYSDRWMFLHPYQYNFKLRVWGCSCMEQYFSLASLMGFLPAVYSLLTTSGHHLPLEMRSEPGSFWNKHLMANTVSVEPHDICLPCQTESTLPPHSYFLCFNSGITDCSHTPKRIFVVSHLCHCI